MFSNISTNLLLGSLSEIYHSQEQLPLNGVKLLMVGLLSVTIHEFQLVSLKTWKCAITFPQKRFISFIYHSTRALTIFRSLFAAYLLIAIKYLPKHSLPSTGFVSFGHFSRQMLVSGSFATLQAKQSEGCKSSAPGFRQPKERQGAFETVRKKF